MKKILLSLAVVLVYIMPANAEVTRALGLTVSSATIESSLKDDIDSNGTVNTRKDISNDIAYGSIFLEVTNDLGAGSITFGVDVIPMEAEFDAKTVAQSSVKAKGDGAATTGNNKGTVDVSQHITAYVQPGYVMPNGMTVFLTAGYVTADVDAEVQSISSTNKTESLSLDGIKLGGGIKADLPNDMFVKLEYALTDYDDISVTTSNNTKVTADMDNEALSLSLGKKF